MPPTVFKDEDGSVIMATVRTYGDTVHTFIERKNYKGIFLPGYKPHHLQEAVNKFAPAIHFNRIDHVVGNQPDH